jgi:hypothetical protein
MPATFSPIATTTLGSAASSITFSSIPGTYTDLRLVLVGSRSASGSSDIFLRFNADTGTTYSQTILYGDGSAAASARDTSATKINMTYFGVGLTTGLRFYTADIFSYAGSTYKTVLLESNEDANGSGYVGRRVGLWSSTSAINQVGLSLSSGNFATNTVATLYGILKA